ncbi:MAG TPA: dienelactone hydrolase family protein [Gemmatimonadaceae bacterium]|nr:dienelactone hydrolase family protein [Gemmatimonadaceae bacterium]
MDGQHRGERGDTASVSSAGVEHAVMIPLDELSLDGTLTLPDGARAIVVFAHGSGSSRHSPRNRFVAEELNAAGLGTLLMDLLTEREGDVDAITGELRFDIGLLAARLVAAIDWLGWEPTTRDLAVGVFGASTGGAAALVAGARLPDRVGAIVSRGGRPDLAEVDLPNVKAPTMLIVGGRDEAVIDLNQKAMARMTSARVKLEIVPGATHLFEEKGALAHVARMAREWFTRNLVEPRAD